MLFRGIAVWMQMILIPLLAVRLGASPLELGLVTSLLLLPTLFIAALGGVLADRVDRGRVLIATQLGTALLSVAIFGLIVSDALSLAALAGCAVVFGVLTAVELPVRQAYLTELVPKADVTSAVSLHATAWNTTRFLGPVVAGALVASLGMADSFLVGAVSAVVVALLFVWMERYREQGRQRETTEAGVLADLREGAAYAIGEPQVRWALVLVAATGILGVQAFQTLAPLYGTQELALDEGWYGLYIGVWGAGAVSAAFFVTAFAHGDRRPWLIGGTLAMAVLLAAIALVGSVPIAFVLAFMLGFSQIVILQNAIVSVQSTVPDELRGRVMGIYTTVFMGSSPIGALLAGWLAELTSVRAAMLTGALGLAAVGLAATLALRRVRSPRVTEPSEVTSAGLDV
jgi:MFS family permease